MKDGWRTSEFWVNMAGAIISYVIGSGILLEGSMWERGFMIASTVLIALGYTISRTLVKRQSALSCLLKRKQENEKE